MKVTIQIPVVTGHYWILEICIFRWNSFKIPGGFITEMFWKQHNPMTVKIVTIFSLLLYYSDYIIHYYYYLFLLQILQLFLITMLIDKTCLTRKFYGSFSSLNIRQFKKNTSLIWKLLLEKQEAWLCSEISLWNIWSNMMNKAHWIILFKGQHFRYKFLSFI